MDQQGQNIFDLDQWNTLLQNYSGDSEYDDAEYFVCQVDEL